MSQYSTTPGQQRYLKAKYAKEKDTERSCDCPGCNTCTGNVRACQCDTDLEGLREAIKNTRHKRPGIKLATNPNTETNNSPKANHTGDMPF